jgi:prophage DNA circulation protein
LTIGAGLMAASFKGVPFWIEKDQASVGRRLDITSYPGSDAWNIEDLGRLPEPIQISGYLIGEQSGSQISALEAAARLEGVGPLVLPAQGPQTARLLTIKRDRHRDKQGRFGFEAHFILIGAAIATAQPAPYLAQLAFDAVGQLSAAAGGFLNGLQV